MLHTILQQHAHGQDFDVSLAIDMYGGQAAAAACLQLAQGALEGGALPV